MTKVLVADDDTDNRALMATVLTSLGVEVLTAETGEEALAVARSQRPDAVLLDVRMPGMSGLQVCEELRRAGEPRVPIILISGCANPEQVAEGKAAGADDYLVKPFRLAEFTRRVTAALKSGATTTPPTPATAAALANRSVAGSSPRYGASHLAAG